MTEKKTERAEPKEIEVSIKACNTVNYNGRMVGSGSVIKIKSDKFNNKIHTKREA
jgi:hypothetical protein